MDKKQDQQPESKISLIDEALLENIAGGLIDAAAADCGPGDCTNHGGCKKPPK